jgi:hypothetical protein
LDKISAPISVALAGPGAAPWGAASTLDSSSTAFMDLARVLSGRRPALDATVIEL